MLKYIKKHKLLNIKRYFTYFDQFRTAYKIKLSRENIR